MRRRGKDEKTSPRFFTEDEKVIDLLKRSAESDDVSPGEALTLEQTVEVLQRLRSRQRPGSPVSIYLDARRGV